MKISGSGIHNFNNSIKINPPRQNTAVFVGQKIFNDFLSAGRVTNMQWSAVGFPAIVCIQPTLDNMHWLENHPFYQNDEYLYLS